MAGNHVSLQRTARTDAVKAKRDQWRNLSIVESRGLGMARGSNTMQHIVKRLGVSSRCWHLLVPMSCCRTVSRAQPDCIRCQHQCM